MLPFLFSSHILVAWGGGGVLQCAVHHILWCFHIFLMNNSFEFIVCILFIEKHFPFEMCVYTHTTQSTHPNPPKKKP